MQPVHPFRVVADHGIPERLPLHAGQSCRFRPRQALKRVGDRQNAHRGTAVRLEPGKAAELSRRQVLADGKGRHGSAPSMPSRHTPRQAATYKSELLWAGITQGKRLVVIVGQKRALAVAVRSGDADEASGVADCGRMMLLGGLRVSLPPLPARPWTPGCTCAPSRPVAR